MQNHSYHVLGKDFDEWGGNNYTVEHGTYKAVIPVTIRGVVPMENVVPLTTNTETKPKPEDDEKKKKEE